MSLRRAPENPPMLLERPNDFRANYPPQIVDVPLGQHVAYPPVNSIEPTDATYEYSAPQSLETTDTENADHPDAVALFGGWGSGRDSYAEAISELRWHLPGTEVVHLIPNRDGLGSGVIGARIEMGADCLVDMAINRGHKKIDVVGHSLGGFISPLILGELISNPKYAEVVDQVLSSINRVILDSPPISVESKYWPIAVGKQTGRIATGFALTPLIVVADTIHREDSKTSLRTIAEFVEYLTAANAGLAENVACASWNLEALILALDGDPRLRDKFDIELKISERSILTRKTMPGFVDFLQNSGIAHGFWHGRHDILSTDKRVLPKQVMHPAQAPTRQYDIQGLDANGTNGPAVKKAMDDLGFTPSQVIAIDLFERTMGTAATKLFVASAMGARHTRRRSPTNTK